MPFDQILAHYYQGTTLGPAPLARVRVLLVPGEARVTVSSDAPFRVRDALGADLRAHGGPASVRARLSASGSPAASSCSS